MKNELISGFVKTVKKKTAKEVTNLNVGVLLKQIRKERNITQKEMSEELQYSDSYISRLENSNIIPKPEILNDISRVYNINTEQMNNDYEVNILKDIFTCLYYYQSLETNYSIYKDNHIYIAIDIYNSIINSDYDKGVRAIFKLSNIKESLSKTVYLYMYILVTYFYIEFDRIEEGYELLTSYTNILDNDRVDYFISEFKFLINLKVTDSDIYYDDCVRRLVKDNNFKRLKKITLKYLVTKSKYSNNYLERIEDLRESALFSINDKKEVMFFANYYNCNYDKCIELYDSPDNNQYMYYLIALVKTERFDKLADELNKFLDKSFLQRDKHVNRLVAYLQAKIERPDSCLRKLSDTIKYYMGQEHDIIDFYIEELKNFYINNSKYKDLYIFQEKVENYKSRLNNFIF